jgi:hypothetical protein
MFLEALLNTLLLVLTVNGTPLASRDPFRVTLPMSRKFNISGASNIMKNDQARARRQLLSKTSEGGFSLAEVNEPITNMVNQYVASVGIGCPSTECKVHTFVL